MSKGHNNPEVRRINEKSELERELVARRIKTEISSIQKGKVEKATIYLRQMKPIQRVQT